MEKLRIIVFEDDPALATMLEHAFLHTRHDVHIFADPTDHLVCHDHEAPCPPDKPCAEVILSDHMMPNITGIDLLLHQKKRNCKIADTNKAIMTGAVIGTELKVTIEKLGCQMFKKPFKVAEILKWVDECAERVFEKRQPSY